MKSVRCAACESKPKECASCHNERSKRYYYANRAEIIKKRTAYAKTHVDTLGPWRMWRHWDKRRGFTGTLSKEEFLRITSMPCHYCGFAGRIGLDRINNAKGHETFNCLPCCDWCNTARSDHFTTHEMLLIGRAIAEIRKAREGNEKLAVLFG